MKWEINKMRERQAFSWVGTHRQVDVVMVVAFLAALALGACASQMEPAQRSINDIEALVTASSAEAAKYVPDQLTDVQNKLGALKASFDQKNYAVVLKDAPAVMSAAQALAGAAAAKKDDVMKALNESWTRLAAELPGDMTTLQSRIDLLSKKSSRKLAAGIDLDAARGGLANASSIWSKAQAAFAAGNLDEAVTTAKSVKTTLEGLASTLQVDLSAPAAATPRS
jgi:acyl-CoA synthetase (AMP-forming)/AMP-acid ligase II